MQSLIPVGNALPVAPVAITAGAEHACAIDDQANVWCWGRGVESQLGDGNTATRQVPIRTLVTKAVSVSAASTHTCALDDQGGMFCFGSNVRGQLGDGFRTTQTSPQPVPNVAGATSVGLGSQHSCASLMTGGVMCWGDNSQGQVGDGSFTSRTKATPVVGLGSVDYLKGGGSHTCARTTAGGIACWGSGGNGELGDGTNNTSSIPRYVTLGAAADQLTSGVYHSCALTGGNAMCWGSPYANTPSDANNGLTGFLGFARSGGHACAILANHTVQCWGDNFYGQLGDGSTVTPTPANTPVVAAGISTAETIYAAEGRTCAILTNGTAMCWGRNYSGTLGTMDNNSMVTSPSPVVGLTGAAQLALRPFFSGSFSEEGTCARKIDGTVMCWGGNPYGQVGDGTYVQRYNATLVGGLDHVKDIGVGQYHTCASKDDGTVVCWGSSGNGQLGDGSKTNLMPTGVRMTCN
jgi:alpha-tubulin suppressor-like RCC1 family protein